MKIGIDCRTILNPGFGEGAGIGHYVYYLVKNLMVIDQENQYVLFFDDLISDDAIREVVGQRPGVTIKRFPFHRFKHYLPYVYSHLLVSQKFNQAKLDVCHFPATSVPARYRGKRVVTVHDLAIYDFPEWFPGQQDFAVNMLVPESIERADRVIVVSQNTKADLLRLFRVPASRVEVIYEGVEIANADEAAERADVKGVFQLRGPYVLYLGTLEPRKNLTVLLRAWREVKTNATLVLAGAKGWQADDIFNELELCRRQRPGSVRYLGYVSHDQKIGLMKNAVCFVFPSLYEGFGLPVLEAMALGAPVITSNVSSLPEIADGAAILINPYSQTEIVEAVTQLLNDEGLRTKYRELGFGRAKIFDWRTTAAKTLQVYRS